MRAQILADLLFSAVLIYPTSRIFQRAGVNHWLSLLLFIPFIGFVVCGLVLAKSQWNAFSKGNHQ